MSQVSYWPQLARKEIDMATYKEIHQESQKVVDKLKEVGIPIIAYKRPRRWLTKSPFQLAINRNKSLHEIGLWVGDGPYILRSMLILKKFL